VTGGGGIDKFRIKIWNRATGEIIYDNVRGVSDDVAFANPQALGDGSITIHTGKVGRWLGDRDSTPDVVRRTTCAVYVARAGRRGRWRVC
jgi:hypothetical protein